MTAGMRTRPLRQLAWDRLWARTSVRPGGWLALGAGEDGEAARVAEAGRAVGQWPTGESLIIQFVERLGAAVEREADPEA